MSQTVGGLILAATKALQRVGVASAGRDARALVAMSTSRRTDRLSLELNENVSDAEELILGNVLKDRLQRKPLSQIIGKRQFFEHEFQVTSDTLDPRPETECLVLAALAGPVKRMLDLGTGTGAVAISILAARPAASGMATDISIEALRVAAGNAEQTGTANRLDLIVSDWFEKVQGKFDLIVSNPPYISKEEMNTLAPELSFEPRLALTDEGDGLSAYRKILDNAVNYLTPGGRLLVEIGWQQGDLVSQLFKEAGLEKIEIQLDLDGRDRVVLGQSSNTY
ncbi:peptide chain release factor N(5)-glutamine methyltransferase [Pseudopelagicola sp. nBUS_20]|uniref:peptide chain release factor N(5)-glutamine methyltransferase n=1 Tax=Pseudopelagicola sp. nBUS_20 TaxID=3395317 RepID=UPI003EBFE589